MRMYFFVILTLQSITQISRSSPIICQKIDQLDYFKLNFTSQKTSICLQRGTDNHQGQIQIGVQLNFEQTQEYSYLFILSDFFISDTNSLDTYISKGFNKNLYSPFIDNINLEVDVKGFTSASPYLMARLFLYKKSGIFIYVIGPYEFGALYPSTDLLNTKNVQLEFIVFPELPTGQGLCWSKKLSKYQMSFHGSSHCECYFCACPRGYINNNCETQATFISLDSPLTLVYLSEKKPTHLVIEWPIQIDVKAFPFTKISFDIMTKINEVYVPVSSNVKIRYQYTWNGTDYFPRFPDEYLWNSQRMNQVLAYSWGKQVIISLNSSEILDRTRQRQQFILSVQFHEIGYFLQFQPKQISSQNVKRTEEVEGEGEGEEEERSSFTNFIIVCSIILGVMQIIGSCFLAYIIQKEMTQKINKNTIPKQPVMNDANVPIQKFGSSSESTESEVLNPCQKNDNQKMQLSPFLVNRYQEPQKKSYPINNDYHMNPLRPNQSPKAHAYPEPSQLPIPMNYRNSTQDNQKGLSIGQMRLQPYNKLPYLSQNKPINEQRIPAFQHIFKKPVQQIRPPYQPQMIGKDNQDIQCKSMNSPLLFKGNPNKFGTNTGFVRPIENLSSNKIRNNSNEFEKINKNKRAINSQRTIPKFNDVSPPRFQYQQNKRKEMNLENQNNKVVSKQVNQYSTFQNQLRFNRIEKNSDNQQRNEPLRRNFNNNNQLFQIEESDEKLKKGQNYQIGGSNNNNNNIYSSQNFLRNHVNSDAHLFNLELSIIRSDQIQVDEKSNKFQIFNKQNNVQNNRCEKEHFQESQQQQQKISEQQQQFKQKQQDQNQKEQMLLQLEKQIQMQLQSQQQQLLIKMQEVQQSKQQESQQQQKQLQLLEQQIKQEQEQQQLKQQKQQQQHRIDVLSSIKDNPQLKQQEQQKYQNQQHDQQPQQQQQQLELIARVQQQRQMQDHGEDQNFSQNQFVSNVRKEISQIIQQLESLEIQEVNQRQINDAAYVEEEEFLQQLQDDFVNNGQEEYQPEQIEQLQIIDARREAQQIYEKDIIDQVLEVQNREVQLLSSLFKLNQVNPEQDMGDKIKNQRECVVCLGDLINDKPRVAMMECLHFFHFNCIEEWGVAHNTCPTCRADFNPQDIIEIQIPDQLLD